MSNGSSAKENRRMKTLKMLMVGLFFSSPLFFGYAAVSFADQEGKEEKK